MNFASDNAAPIVPEILAAIERANEGFALAYGNDQWTRALERRMSEVFERDVAMFLVATGTAANALAVAHCSQPWSSVLCFAEAHLATDEADAPEFYGGGLKLALLPGANGKLAPDTVKVALGKGRGVPHSVIPGVLSLSQSTELGTVYRTDQVRALAEVAHKGGLLVHLDGARLGNAIAALGCTPAGATWKAGVDVLSFGATKCGALEAEAVVFFDPKRAEGMPSRRKRAGQLISKQRFMAAQFDAFLPARPMDRGRAIFCLRTPLRHTVTSSCASSLRSRPPTPIWKNSWELRAEHDRRAALLTFCHHRSTIQCQTPHTSPHRCKGGFTDAPRLARHPPACARHLCPCTGGTGAICQ
jgi:threonine aldolase